ncbi:NADPH-dependent FMN reductase [Tellurirhabdus bombi]|uniref:NADPH-dependent FMN reductase n=1 Tax=Tellurirhabdus bombi TaxID=2907205 RepID=UPI001F2B305B|nr:NAD(P)H-dependent oxidoreductase [Tellurirhabdus bombi]
MITIVSSTNRRDNKSIQVAYYYQNLLSQKGVESRILDLTELPSDFIETALYGSKNERFNELRYIMETAEKYVFVIPEYNNSFPGVLKAFIDGLSYPNALAHKKCALVGISDGVQGNALGLSHITDVFNYLGMHVMAQKVRIPLMKKNFLDHEIQDAFIRKLVDEQAELFLHF